MHLAAVSPVVAAAFFLNEAQLRTVAPTSFLGQAFIDHFGLHIDQHGFGNRSLVEELRQECLMRWRCLASFLMHGGEERLADLVAALSDLYERHCHYCSLNEWAKQIQLIIR